MRLTFRPDGGEVRVRPAPPCSTAPAGTASRSTPPAAATALQEVQGAGAAGEVPIDTLDPRAFTPDELRDGWRLACRAIAQHDLEIEVPPLQTRPKAALVGVGRHVILRPAVQKRYLELDEPSLEDQPSDLERVLAAIDDMELRSSWARCATSAARCELQLQGHGGHLRRPAAGCRAGRHQRPPPRDRVRPRHHHGGRDAARPRHRPAAGGALDARTASSHSAPT